jgi:hypothetical protein
MLAYRTEGNEAAWHWNLEPRSQGYDMPKIGKYSLDRARQVVVPVLLTRLCQKAEPVAKERIT